MKINIVDIYTSENKYLKKNTTSQYICINVNLVTLSINVEVFYMKIQRNDILVKNNFSLCLKVH